VNNTEIQFRDHTLSLFLHSSPVSISLFQLSPSLFFLASLIWRLSTEEDSGSLAGCETISHGCFTVKAVVVFV